MTNIIPENADNQQKILLAKKLKLARLEAGITHEGLVQAFSEYLRNNPDHNQKIRSSGSVKTFGRWEKPEEIPKYLLKALDVFANFYQKKGLNLTEKDFSFNVNLDEFLDNLKNKESDEIDKLIKIWRDAKKNKAFLLSEYLHLKSEVLTDFYKTEAEYFSMVIRDDQKTPSYQPIKYQKSGLPIFKDNATDFINNTGLTLIMADFSEDTCETLRYIHNTICKNENDEETLPIFIPAQFLIEETIDESVIMFQKEFLDAPIDSSVKTLNTLNERLSLQEGNGSSATLVMMIDFSWFNLTKISDKIANSLSKIFQRLLELEKVLKHNRQALILGIPKHFFLIPDFDSLINQVARVYTSVPLFSAYAENRGPLLESLLGFKKLTANFIKQIFEMLECKKLPKEIAFEVDDLPRASFLKCNSNALIYRIASSIDMENEVIEWKDNLIRSLNENGFWEPAIRLAQYRSGLNDKSFKYVSMPVDIYPKDEKDIYGLLDGAESIPLFVQKGLLYAESGGGKTSVLKILEFIYSIPRPIENDTSSSWLPLPVTMDLKPLNSIVKTIMSKIGGTDITSLLKIFSSPVYLLIDDIGGCPKELLTSLKIFLNNPKTQLGVLLTQRTYPGFNKFTEDLTQGISDLRKMGIRSLSPELAGKISGAPIKQLLSVWAMIGLPQSQLCKNPFILSSCASELTKANTKEDQLLVDLLDNTLENRIRHQNQIKMRALVNELLPLIAYQCTRLGKPTVGGDDLHDYLPGSKRHDYDSSFLEAANHIQLMVIADKEKKTYAFRHSIYREYFTAKYLADDDSARLEAVAAAESIYTGQRWYNCLRLMVPLLTKQKQDALLELVCVSKNPDLFGVILSSLRPFQLRTMLLDALPDIFFTKQPANKIHHKLSKMFNLKKSPDVEELGLADPRVFILSLSDNEIQSELDQKVAYKVKAYRWGNIFELGKTRYQLAKYPVTNLEFYNFVKDGGYNKEKGGIYWDSRPRGFGDIGGTKYFEKYQPKCPRYWDIAGETDKLLNQANCPVVGVTLHEANAYCRWLTRRDGYTRQKYRLPKAAEWTWVAYSRWPEIREAMMSVLPDIPQGQSFLSTSDSFKTNAIKEMIMSIKTELRNRGPVPVGSFYDDKSGCSDLFGNVWEWCDTLLDEFRLFVRGGPSPVYDLYFLLFDGFFNPWQQTNNLGFRILRELDSNNE